MNFPKYILRTTLVLIFSFSVPGISFAQVDPSTMGTTVLKNTADMLVSAGKYAEAIPYLEELHTRLKDQITPEGQLANESVIYSLGLSYISVSDYQNATKYFEIYLEKFRDKNISRTIRAMDMIAEAYFASMDYPKASYAYLDILKSRHTLETSKRTARLNLLDSYINIKQWPKLISVGRDFVKDGRDPEAQARAATALCQAYVMTDQPEKVFELIPILENATSSARYRVDFNVSMLTAGDRMFQAGKFDMALPLYQLVAPKRNIEKWLTERIEVLKQQREELVKMRPVPPNFGVLAASLKGQTDRLNEQLESLKDIESYDEELRSRQAQTLFKQGRRWEALWVFESLMDDFPDSEFGEKAGYAAFALAAELGQRDRAVALGKDYLDSFPKGENYDTLSWQLTQLMVSARLFQEAQDNADAVLKLNPEHIFADKILFLMGYALFQEEQMDKAADIFLRLRKEYPESESRESSDYWYAMTILYRADYVQAYEQFKLFAEGYPNGIFHTDAVFRSGVCQYALEKYDQAREIFDDFVKKYPEAPQVSEAHLLLGDIAGADGRLKDALTHYSLVDKFTINQGSIDYATMAAGRALEALEEWDQMIAWFTKYLNTYGTSALYAEAIYRIGFAKKQKNDIDGMLATYLDAITKYGNDPNAIGVDLITRDWPTEYRASKNAMPDLIIRKELADAVLKGNKTMAMRWMMMKEWMDKQNGTTSPGAQPMEITEVELESASPAILVWAGDNAQQKGDKVLARKAYARVMSNFEDNEWYLPAHMALARMDIADGKDDDAIAHFMKIRELFPSSDEAAIALYEQAMLLAKQKKNQEAVDLLGLILEVKEWRGETWARALYTIGTMLQEQGKNEEAFGYYQRVYVLYGAYKDYAAKAYLQSAKCLAALGRENDRIATLKEFVANEGFKNQPEYSEAEKILSRN